MDYIKLFPGSDLDNDHARTLDYFLAQYSLDGFSETWESWANSHGVEGGKFYEYTGELLRLGYLEALQEDKISVSPRGFGYGVVTKAIPVSIQKAFVGEAKCFLRWQKKKHLDWLEGDKRKLGKGKYKKIKGFIGELKKSIGTPMFGENLEEFRQRMRCARESQN